MKALIILVAVMLPLATAASADRPNSEKQSTPSTETFKSLDRNRDQSLSKVEAKADPRDRCGVQHRGHQSGRLHLQVGVRGLLAASERRRLPSRSRRFCGNV